MAITQTAPLTPSESRALVAARAATLVVLSSHFEEICATNRSRENSDELLNRLIAITKSSFPWLDRECLEDYLNGHRRLYKRVDWGDNGSEVNEEAATGGRVTRSGATAAAASASGGRSTRARASSRGRSLPPPSPDPLPRLPPSQSRPRSWTGTKPEAKPAPPRVKRSNRPANKVELNQKSDMEFNSMLSQLMNFKSSSGHCRVPDTLRYDPSHTYAELSKWVGAVRRTYNGMTEAQRSCADDHEMTTKSTQLTPQRISALEDLGFEFRILPQESIKTWQERLEQCRAFLGEHGHLRIPVNDPVLGQWCSHIRTQHKINREGNHTKSMRGGKKHKRSFLTPEREEQLNELGFVWQVRKRQSRGQGPKSWEERYEEMIRFKKEHGHVKVSRLTNPSLFGWVNYQRRDYRLMIAGEKCSITPEKVERLFELGFEFETAKSLKRSSRKRKRIELAEKEDSAKPEAEVNVQADEEEQYSTGSERDQDEEEDSQEEADEGEELDEDDEEEGEEERPDKSPSRPEGSGDALSD